MKRKFMQPLVVAAVSALAISLLAGCGSSGGVGGQKSAAQSTSGPVTLNYWTWYPDQKTTQTAIDGFEKANPSIKVNLRLYTSVDYQKDLPLALNGGSKLDVVGVQVSAMTNTVKSNLRPVSTYAKDLVPGWKTKLDPKLVKQTQAAASDNVLYDLPMGEVSSPFVFYNASLLKKYDIPVPTTADELAAASKKLEAAGITQPVVEVGDGWWQEEVLFGIIGQTDPTLSDKIFLGKASWNQPAIVKGLADYKSLFDSGAITTSTLSLTGSAPDAAFDTGKAAFLVGGAWESSILSASYRKANDITLSDVGATSFPIVERKALCTFFGRRRIGDPEVVDSRCRCGEVHLVHDLRRGRQPVGFQPRLRACSQGRVRADIGVDHCRGEEGLCHGRGCFLGTRLRAHQSAGFP